MYLKQIEGISKVASLITSGLYLDELLRLVVNVTAELMNSKICSLMLLDPEKKELVIKATQSVSEAYNKKPNIKLGEGVSGKVAKENKPICVLDVKEDISYKNRDIAEKEGICSLASVPLAVKGRVIGVLNCYTTKKHKFTKYELDMLSAMANQAAVAIENAELDLRARSAEEALLTRKMVERAKDILSQEANILPSEAYRLIQKQSMDSRKSMREIAEAIILAKDIKAKT
ncbi:MAG: GAF and ANTAR domain-containing protein [Candidatus Omnitrophica bacterium]|nr:GAF and ANTAR domain-containing protein [Candidatus Omnitrophota bacterium]MBU1929374.1 GAF and ANTAR domain-containing protein [Candidatus Omnitrophota bacterium]MBU2034886.1 GAF and ANTAR domain-containing protein [Candidatus Omnitrophota bacterium]MBU2222093.1 GAF and ANTAR domain-containing protein [Candidatus Omnitrophota bacterium]MBU2258871.1 GAF and ANTAR domain-containing protein [Candidatus Omnitrophota bacterium]